MGKRERLNDGEEGKLVDGEGGLVGKIEEGEFS